MKLLKKLWKFLIKEPLSHAGASYKCVINPGQTNPFVNKKDGVNEN